MRSTILTCSALLVAGSVAQSWHPHDDGSTLYRRDAYPEADAYAEADPYAEADAYADAEAWADAEADADAEPDDMEWAMSTREVPEFDGPVSTRRSLLEDEGLGDPRLSRRDWGNFGSYFGMGGKQQGQHEEAPAKGVPERESQPYGSPGGMKEDIYPHSPMPGQHEPEKPLALTDVPHRETPQGWHGIWNKALPKFSSQIEAKHPGKQGEFFRMVDDRHNKMLGQFNEKKAQYLEKLAQEHPEIYKYGAHYGGKMMAGGKGFMNAMKEGGAHPIVAKRSLDPENAALLHHLERRAAHQGRMAHAQALAGFDME